MTTLIFLAGVGVGSVVACLFLFAMLMWCVRNSKNPKAEKYNETTIALMQDRNATDVKIEKHLSVVAEWAQQNWER